MLLPLLQFIRFRHGPSPSFLLHVYTKCLRNGYLFAFALATCRQIFGDTIICQNSETSSLSSHYVDTKCFLNGTLTRDFDSKEVQIYHDYYQWVPVVLLLGAFHFHYPLQLWFKAFGSLFRYLRGAKDEDSAQTVSNAVLESAAKGIFWKILLLECWYLAHTILAAWALDTFFHGFWSRNEFSTAPTLEILFPEQGVCTFDYVSGSADKTARIICLLPLNSVYRKIFAVVFESFKVTIGFHTAILFYRIVLLRRVGLCKIDLWWAAREAIESSETWNGKRHLEKILKPVYPSRRSLGECFSRKKSDDGVERNSYCNYKDPGGECEMVGTNLFETT